MNIWFVELGEPLPFQHQQRLLRYGELTRLLAGRGHRVTWWACDFSHQTKSFVGEPNSRIGVDGVEIVLVHGTGYRRNVGLARLRHLRAHARQLARLIAGEKPPDIVVSAMPTIEACTAVVAYCKRHGVPVVVDIRDEWPEDYLRWLGPLLRPLGRLVLASAFAALRRACRGADALMAVSKQQLDYGLAAAGRPQSVDDHVFHTGARRAQLDTSALARAVETWRRSGLTADRFVCSFAGTLSPSRPLDPIIDAVKRLAERIPISLAIAGRGDCEPEYRARAGGHPAIKFVGWIDAVAMAGLFEVSDVLLAPYRADYGFSLPTKIFDYMAAGRPIVSSCPGEAQALLRETGCGLQYRHDDSADVERALLALHDDPARRQIMGRTAREVFEQQFALDTILERYATHLEMLNVRFKPVAG